MQGAMICACVYVRLVAFAESHATSGIPQLVADVSQDGTKAAAAAEELWNPADWVWIGAAGASAPLVDLV